MTMGAPSSASARFAPAAARNRDPILAVLREHLPANGLVLEIASGTGEHAVHFAAALPGVTWQPSDPDADARASIAAHREMAALANLLAPIELDAALPVWPLAQADAIVSINMIHIAPWAACLGLIAGAERLLPPNGVLFLYGPFRENGGFEAASNAAFDADLRGRNPAWGIRDREEVADIAAKHGLQFAARVAMPANNLSLVFRKAA
jgi:SAM-dependent methyltransferase